MNWCFDHPEEIFAAYLDGRRFLAIHPEQGIVATAADEEEFEAKLADHRPSVLRQLYCTATNFWVQEGEA